MRCSMGLYLQPEVHFNHDRAHVHACNAGTVKFPITGMIGNISITKPGFMHLSV